MSVLSTAWVDMSWYSLLWKSSASTCAQQRLTGSSRGLDCALLVHCLGRQVQLAVAFKCFHMDHCTKQHLTQQSGGRIMNASSTAQVDMASYSLLWDPSAITWTTAHNSI